MDWKRHLSEASSRLSQAGISDASQEAVILLEWASGRSFHDWVIHGGMWSQVLDHRFRQAVDRRSKREPLFYITGVREFYGLSLTISPAVLIPRPETEGLVDAVLRTLNQDEAFLVDVGTGSGAVALAIQSVRPRWRVLGVDISDEALRVAKGNGERLGLLVAFHHSDLLEAILEPLDAVVANLPYVPDAFQGEPELAYEPATALFGGADGLRFIRRLISEAWAKLKANGYIFLECGIGQAEAISKELLAQGFTSVEVQADLAGIPRVIQGRRL